eukprot:gb/GEZN01003283.1/.p1 GENE.gb/GEZN01003283.1/~~gb/GEZN01003283.1/.p1  ORF type:complete len:526 (+),score=94.74 gb/GEZN01003283.1/:154-1731(+)
MLASLSAAALFSTASAFEWPAYLPDFSNIDINGGNDGDNTRQTYGMKEVDLSEMNVVIPSYAGYYRIQSPISETSEKMFGWFFPSQSGRSSDPLILQLSGCAGTLDVFWENGAITVNSSVIMNVNEFGWSANASVLYLDQPFGVGFTPRHSLGMNEFDEREISYYIYQFLRSFFEEFKSFGYSNSDFYIHGQDAAGHYASVLGAYILEQNEVTPSHKIKLAGVALGNAWVNPQIQYNAEPFAIQSRLLASNTAADLRVQELYDQCYESIQMQEYLAARKKCSMIVPKIAYSTEPIYDEFTQMSYPINAYNIKSACYTGGDVPCYNSTHMTSLLNTQQFQQALLGQDDVVKWVGCNPHATAQLSIDQLRNFAQTIPLILNKGIPVLVYNGMLDLQVDYLGSLRMLEAMVWDNQNDFKKIGLDKWRAAGLYNAGKFKSFQGLTYLAVENAGHFVSHDQPEIGAAVISQFINRAFAKSTSSSSRYESAATKQTVPKIEKDSLKTTSQKKTQHKKKPAFPKNSKLWPLF